MNFSVKHFKILDKYYLTFITIYDHSYATVLMSLQYIQYYYFQAKADVSVGGSYLGFSASIGVNFDKFKSSQSYETKFGTYQYTLVSGSPSVPEPIGIRVVTMDETLSPKYWQKISEFVQDGACHLQNSTGKALLTVLKNNILRALSEYPAFMRAPASSGL